MQWDKEANCALRDPLADTVAGALLHAGDQGGVINYAVEDLALRRFGCAHGGGVGTDPGRVRAAAHGDGSIRGTSEGCSREGDLDMASVEVCGITESRTVVGRLEEGKCVLDGRQNSHLCARKGSRSVHCVRAGLAQRSE